MCYRFGRSECSALHVAVSVALIADVLLHKERGGNLHMPTTMVLKRRCGTMRSHLLSVYLKKVPPQMSRTASLAGT